jgi:Leucine-rich repeat (LRR) protein
MLLTYLNCSNNKIEDLSPLQGMPLKTLNITGNPVTSLVALKDTKLQELTCSKTSITTLQPISSLSLQSLNANTTDITSIKPLQDMPLRRLNIFNCKHLKDIYTLSDIPTLEDLIFPHHIQDFSFLRHMPNLKYIVNTEAQLKNPHPQPSYLFWEKQEQRKLRKK